MQIRPILAALRCHKTGTALVALQVALTLAIVCNALFVIHQRVAHLLRPTGMDEAGLVVVNNDWIEHLSARQQAAMLETDLAALRGLPGVIDASAGNTVPLAGPSWLDEISLDDGPHASRAPVSVYFADTHTLSTLGLRLLAGRNFRADEIGDFDGQGELPATQCIVTRPLVEALQSQGGMLGRAVYIQGRPCTVVGVVASLQGQMAGMGGPTAYNSLLLPMRSVAGFGLYLVRTRPDAVAAMVRDAPKALLGVNRMRLVDAQPYADIRTQVYGRDRGLALIMGVISVVLLAITAAGIVGLTSFWVGQRRKQIGVRRALGARQRDILGYFLTENLLISGGGVLLGVLLAVAMNLWLVVRFAMQPLSLAYVAVGVVLLLLLGQGAVLAPALRASKVPPVEATRSV
ncbi:ABC transporter permease [Frateuria defendens]|uniref:ABC transporter permease n=1 Tax=Frateuria defendens TaxID=2219559 RepID=UPI00066FF963|nr:FtsX-like permease family protein [Frateuria defendens]